MVPTAPFPQALLIPERYKSGATQAARVDGMCTLAESLLGLDRDRGETALLHVQHPISLPAEVRAVSPEPMIFATGDKAASLFFPPGHPLSGKSRYAWTRQPDGIWRGYLVPECEVPKVDETETIRRNIVERRNGGVYAPITAH